MQEKIDTTTLFVARIEDARYLLDVLGNGDIGSCKLPGFDPIEVTTKVVRESGRIRVIDAEFISGGVSMARATCQFLKRTENSEGNVWKPGTWNVPAPLDIPEPENRGGMGGMWASRPISGGLATAEQRRTWMSEVRDIVEVTIRESRDRTVTLLFDREHNLEERILSEQFMT